MRYCICDDHDPIDQIICKFSVCRATWETAGRNGMSPTHPAPSYGGGIRSRVRHLSKRPYILAFAVFSGSQRLSLNRWLVSLMLTVSEVSEDLDFIQSVQFHELLF